MATIDKTLFATLRRLCGPIPTIGGVKPMSRHWQYFHWLEYAAAGHTSLTWFNVPRTKYVTNLPQAGSIDGGTVFALQGVKCIFQTGTDILGAAVAAGVQSSAAATTALTNAEEVRSLMECNCEVKLTVADWTVLHTTTLAQLASGGGVTIAGGCGPATGSLAKIGNGAAINMNGWRMKPKGFPILPNQAIALNVEWPAAQTVTGKFLLGFLLDGTLVTKSA
ncbi:MAG: hypothetical protein KAS72_07805 [Phycisphaerales bacterium]|nr:hypothetical protein [Phycisphaerales bacterium]